jgi:hypothetical protein
VATYFGVVPLAIVASGYLIAALAKLAEAWTFLHITAAELTWFGLVLDSLPGLGYSIVLGGLTLSALGSRTYRGPLLVVAGVLAITVGIVLLTRGDAARSMGFGNAIAGLCTVIGASVFLGRSR